LPLIIFRRAISIVVFILFVLMFLNIEPLAVFLSKVLPPFQAVPALMWTIIDPATLFTAGLILILILTMFFGRIYCSLLCPLGALQDLMTAGFRRLNIRQHRNFAKPLNYLRYSVLILTVATFWGGVAVAGLPFGPLFIFWKNDCATCRSDSYRDLQSRCCLF